MAQSLIRELLKFPPANRNVRAICRARMDLVAIDQEPEALLRPTAEGNSKHPGPLEELEFWEQKAIDVNGIFAQLQSDRVRKILRYLDHNK